MTCHKIVQEVGPLRRAYAVSLWKRSTEAASSLIASKTISRSGFRRVGRLSWVSPEPVNEGREELQWLAKESGSFAGQWLVLEWVASG